MPGITRNGGSFGFFGPSAERDYAIEHGMPEDEFGAVMFIGTVDDPRNPPCPGPVVVHADGTIECEAGCAGVARAYHGAGNTVPCNETGGSANWRFSAWLSLAMWWTDALCEWRRRTLSTIRAIRRM